MLARAALSAEQAASASTNTAWQVADEARRPSTERGNTAPSSSLRVCVVAKLNVLDVSYRFVRRLALPSSDAHCPHPWSMPQPEERARPSTVQGIASPDVPNRPFSHPGDVRIEIRQLLRAASSLTMRRNNRAGTGAPHLTASIQRVPSSHNANKAIA